MYSSDNKKFGIKNWNRVMTIVQIIMLVLVAGVGNWFTKDFSIEYIFSPEWWGDTLTQIIYNYAMLFVVFNYRIKMIRKTNTEYLDRVKAVDKAVSNLHPDKLSRWLLEFNLNEKRKQFVRELSIKLEKLESKSKDKDILIWTKGTEEQKKKNKYCRLKSKYLKMLSNEYIEENLIMVKTSYKPIKKSFITNGYNKKGNDNANIVVEGTFSKTIGDLLPRTIVMTLVVVILRSIALSIADSQNWVMMVFETLLTLVPMVLHANIGWDYASVFNMEKDMVDVRNREELIAMCNSSNREVIYNGMETS